MRFQIVAVIVLYLVANAVGGQLAPHGSPAQAEETIVRVGAGSYSLQLPAGAKGPQREIYATENFKGKVPTNDWWSSAAWMKYSERQYPHPLAVQAEPGGLRVYYPGTNITANRDAIFGFMPPDVADDLILAHSETAAFSEARVDAASDWFVSLRWRDGEKSLRTTYGHGSPFVFSEYEGGSPQLKFSEIPHVWHGDAKSAVLGCTIRGKHYALFGPSGSRWEGLGTKTFTNRSEKTYFSLALLPEASKQALDLFACYGYSHVVHTRVSWEYAPENATVISRFEFVTKAREGKESGTLFALYPHQWRNMQKDFSEFTYDSVRGVMKLAAGTSFTTTMQYPGVLPCLPAATNVTAPQISALIKQDSGDSKPPLKDTYWDGKWLGKFTTLANIADSYSLSSEAQYLREAIRNRLEGWLTANKNDDKSGQFVYNDRWGTLIGYPASYGSDVELNDHHFHYGYLLQAAAHIAEHDPAWAKDERWGGMVKLLIRDVASPDRNDPLFPFLRNFDPYAGHTWASGHAKFGDGNNNESSSEAMNAWCGLILWGEATGDQQLRDLGVYLYTTEMNAIQEYWFDVRDENHPSEFTPSVVTMVWGGKGANGTWFSANPEVVHGINWLPLHGGSLYLGQRPKYVHKNYQALVSENKSAAWDEWRDLVWMYRALDDADDAWQQLQADRHATEPEGGNSRANTLHWIAALRELGHVDSDITANDPLTAVFSKGSSRTYVAYNVGKQPKQVRFSDGTTLGVDPHRFTVKSIPPQK